MHLKILFPKKSKRFEEISNLSIEVKIKKLKTNAPIVLTTTVPHGIKLKEKVEFTILEV
ncbi:MAG: hypothetical protein PWP54_41 [Thermosipho sp. (in: thermotogales)]|nr:hypothetical protein [Thermosipho sp. (in: thermotogales)]